MYEADETPAILLEKVAYGPRSIKMLALTEKFGMIHVYQRRGSYDSCDYIDVFDHVFLMGHMKREKIMFSDECNLIKSFKCVANTYNSFIRLSEFFLLIKKIVEPGFRCDDIFDLTKNLLTAVNSGSNHDIVILKSLYMLCRIEGVDFNAFVESLPQNAQKSLISALRSKMDDCFFSKEIDFCIDKLLNFIEVSLV